MRTLCLDDGSHLPSTHPQESTALGAGVSPLHLTDYATGRALSFVALTRTTAAVDGPSRSDTSDVRLHLHITVGTLVTLTQMRHQSTPSSALPYARHGSVILSDRILHGYDSPRAGTCWHASSQFEDHPPVATTPSTTAPVRRRSQVGHFESFRSRTGQYAGARVQLLALPRL